MIFGNVESQNFLGASSPFGHSISSHSLGIEVDDAIEIAEKIDI
jgi:hypothetical protein